MEQIFEPFFTTKKRGTGLGLALTKQVVQAHDGTIDAQNAPKGGAVFRIVLPAP
jgi:signal transduction histidine kinase